MHGVNISIPTILTPGTHCTCAKQITSVGEMYFNMLVLKYALCFALATGEQFASIVLKESN